ncbi:MAG: PAAR domain-containing protein [Myxococcota bacterium]|nr:PAAR domain-containing protein [Myxococcota bacterium]
MPPQSKVGDKALCPADSHGKPCCAHPVQGPGVNGSPNVLVNNMPALRLGDPGVHSGCCGPNTWNVSAGSATVFFNNIKAARIGDQTVHCGGSGNLIEGSSDVITGG